MTITLPRYVAFKHPYSKDSYVKYQHEGPDKGFLKYSSSTVVRVYTKFEIVPAKAGSPYINIKCCYNNKYLAPSNDDLHMLTPIVDEPQEDKNNWPCTLFRVELSGMSDGYKFRDIRLYNYVGVCTATNDIYKNGLTSRKEDRFNDEVHVIVDFDRIFQLPRHVVFKGDNEKYLALAWYKGDSYLEFSSDDVGHPNVSNTVFTMNDGSVRFKADATKKFWKRESNWIQPHSGDETGGDINTYFWPVKISKNVVALRSLGNNKYCKRLTGDNKISCLNADLESITKEAQFEVEEPVISRKIYNVNFRTLDAKIKNEKILTMATGNTQNDGSQPVTVALQMKYTETKSKSWDSSLTLGMGMKVSLEAGIPLVGKTNIEIETTFTGSYSWGENISKTEEVSATYNVIVPPKTRMKVSLLGSLATCNIPFSYTKKDILKTGEQVTTLCDDGIYTGVNSYIFDYKSETTPI